MPPTRGGGDDHHVGTVLRTSRRRRLGLVGRDRARSRSAVRSSTGSLLEPADQGRARPCRDGRRRRPACRPGRTSSGYRGMALIRPRGRRSWPGPSCSRRTWPRSAATISAHQLREAGAVPPAQAGMGLGRVAQQVVDLERAEVARVDLDQELAGAAVDALARPRPGPARRARGRPRRRRAPRTRAPLWASPVASTQSSALVVLQDPPHALDIVARVAPVAPGVEVAEPQPVLQAELDRGHARG